MTTYRLTATLVLHDAIPPDDALLRLRRVLASESDGVSEITLEPVLKCQPPSIHVYLDVYGRCECQRVERVDERGLTYLERMMFDDPGR